MVLISLGPWQVTNSQDEKLHAPIERSFTRRQRDRYEVVMDLLSPETSAHFEYQIEFSVIPKPTETVETTESVKFVNLKATYDDREAPENKLFGTATYRFGAGGFPIDFSFGKDSPFVIPILSWFLPLRDDIRVSRFTVPDSTFDENIHVSGSGNFDSYEDGKGFVNLDLDVIHGVNTTLVDKFHAKTSFSLKNGALVSSDGTLIRANGTKLTFHVKQINDLK